MTRNASRLLPAASSPQRHVLQQFETWIVLVTLWGLVVNEWIGPGFLGLGLVLWVIYCLQHPAFMVRSLGELGLIPWLLPLLGLASVLWSQDPVLSGRSAIQLGLTFAMALMTAKLVSPRRFIMSLWVVLGTIVILSLIKNNQYHDNITGRTSMAGIFYNKNSLSVCSAGFAVASAGIYFDRGYPGPLRAAGFLGIGLGVVLCILAYSVGGIVAMFLALSLLTIVVSAYLLPQRLRTNYAEMVLLVSLCGGALLLFGMLAFQTELLALAGKDGTLTGRTLLWFYGGRMAQDHPFLGVGYNAFWLRGTAPAEFLWKKMHIDARSGFHFHSLYYETLMQLGYVGVVAGFLVIIRCLFAVLVWIRRAPNVYSGFFLAYLMMILCTQWQSIGAFTQFDMSAYFLVLSSAYAVRWCRDEVRMRRMPAPPCRPSGDRGPDLMPSGSQAIRAS